MASQMMTLSLLEEEVTCSICCGIFGNPVVLSCSHSFCKECLQAMWSKKPRECPLCRRKSSKDFPPLNLALGQVCELIKKDKAKQNTSAGQSALCALHSECLKLYCKEDEEPLCVDCIGSGKHQNHVVCRLTAAVQDRKEELKTELKPLKEKLDNLTKMKQSCDSTALYIKNQADKTEGQIREEFEKLYRFLRDEEASRITLLREEEELKRRSLDDCMETIGRKLASLSETIESIEKEMEIDDMSFLQNYKETKRRVQVTLQDPESFPVPLIDVSKHLSSLKYDVWRKMLEIVQYTPLSLQPLSAHPQLSLSEELTSVRYNFRGKSLPDNAERFDLYVFVLGSEGYASGTHTWEVEVGNKPNCRIGVARQSVRRKGNFVVCPKEGFYTIVLRNREFRVGTSPETRLDFRRKPQRIRVCLDCDKGEVSFSDPSNDVLIHTFTDTFTEKMYPFFGPSKDYAPLRICSKRVSVDHEE